MSEYQRRILQGDIGRIILFKRKKDALLRCVLAVQFNITNCALMKCSGVSPVERQSDENCRARGKHT